jgi:hypothetical protein
MSNSFPPNTGNFSAFASAAHEARDSDRTRDDSSRERIQPPIAPATSFPSSLGLGGHRPAKRSLGQRIPVDRHPIERTELERRVLAHERILQALIAHIAEVQPEILARLKLTFGTGHNWGEYEQDYTSTEHYGDRFIRNIESLITRRPG